ncbi:MAG: AAA family ATPase [Acidobacteria bacterium]|nr:AAA family ATPase [Acidobacteriota bacterium]
MTPVLDKIKNMQAAIETVVRGKSDAVRLSLICLLAEGHLLIEDVPGVGKTTLAQTLARSFDCAFRRIQFTSDLLPSDITGVSIFDQADGKFNFRKGPIFANIVLADEINRAAPRTQSALLEAMSEGKVSVDDATRELPRPFMVAATQNPVEHHGTYPLPESQLDRFLICIRMGYPSRDAEKELLRRTTGGDRAEHVAVAPVCTAEDILAAQACVRDIRVDESLFDYLMAIVDATRKSEFLLLGASPRAALALRRAAQATAYIEGRNYCIPDDIKQLAPFVLAHRLVVGADYSSNHKRSEEAGAILAEIIRSIEIPH